MTRLAKAFPGLIAGAAALLTSPLVGSSGAAPLMMTRAVVPLTVVAQVSVTPAVKTTTVVVPPQAISIQGNTTVAAPAAGAQPSAAKATNPDGTPAAAAPETERMKRLKTLTYDRRPSAILKAWSEPFDPNPKTNAPGEEGMVIEAIEMEESDGEIPDDLFGGGGSVAAPAIAATGALSGVTLTISAIGGAAVSAPAAPAASAPATAPAAAATTPPSSAPTNTASTTPAAAAPTGSTAAQATKPPVIIPALPIVPRPKTPTPEEAAAAQQKKQKEEAAKKVAEAKALDTELRLLQRHVTLGNWAEVKKYLASIPAAEAKEGYAQMLRSLAGDAQQQALMQQAQSGQLNPQMMQQLQQMQRNGQVAEQNSFRMDDVFALTAACPHKLDKKTITALGPILRQTITTGAVLSEVLAEMQKQAEAPADKALLTRRQCAQLLVAAGQTIEVPAFLPKLEEAVAAKDSEGIVLLARGLLAAHGKDRKPELLEQAWQALQATLALEGIDKESQAEALKLAVDLAPKVKESLGQTWLEESFTNQPDRGMRILAAIGTAAANGLQTQPHNSDGRLKTLQLQRTAVEALLKSAPDRAKEWQSALEVLAQGWKREGEYSRVASQSSQFGPRMRRDRYGNLFYMNEDEEGMVMQQNDGNRPQPIPPTELLEIGPSETWLAQLDPSLRPSFFALYAQLYLKVSEEDRAYPYIERLAATHPDLTRNLANEFIRVWTKNHDPNSSRRYSNPYMFMFGYERKAESIPLTRSKQQRNLTELAGWVKKLRALPIKDLDESLFATAFTTCHSSAEVYRLESLELVLGAAADLEPKTLGKLVQQIRENLGGQWRMPSEQEEKKTRRKQKDIEAEVLRGYGVAAALLADGLKKHPDDWQLKLAQACLLHDEVSFQKELAPSSEFSERRLEAIATFAKAAELYAAKVPSLREDEQTAEVYEHWYYASLGASDLGKVDHKQTPDARQPALIRAAMAALPGQAAEYHQTKFANDLFTRMSAVKPNVKFRYLNGGFEIVGDHEQAREARKLYDYYKDLVTEIKLVTRVDGSSNVGQGEAFGVFVELQHTPEIERESGGFGKYLQNQNNQNGFYYNFGRPLENYRDKFQESITAALSENFEVQSVTFQSEDVSSRPAKEFGWRTTPYAYLLLKSRGEQIDKIPSLKMDLDFLDTSGFVMLPIHSAALPIDASKSDPAGRPNSKLEITQTLDERQADKGKLVLEVKATAHGLVPPLEKLVDLTAAKDFTVGEIDDRGVSISRFDPESSEPVVISERNYTVTLTGREDLAALPKEFTFPGPKLEADKVTYQRYNDADLDEVEQTVSLEKQYGDVSRPWLWGLLAIPFVALAIGAAWWMNRGRVKQTAKSRFQVPAQLTPFSVLALLRNIQANDGLSTDMHRELAGSIQSLERHYFADTSVSAPDLRTVAENWVSRAR